MLLERRPDKGLLGGTLGFPGSDWSQAPTPAPPLKADWIEAPSQVHHSFTHFHLDLRVFVALCTGTGFIPHAEFRPGELPTLMRKVWDAARSVELVANRMIEPGPSAII